MAGCPLFRPCGGRLFNVCGGPGGPLISQPLGAIAQHHRNDRVCNTLGMLPSLSRKVQQELEPDLLGVEQRGEIAWLEAAALALGVPCSEAAAHSLPIQAGIVRRNTARSGLRYDLCTGRYRHKRLRAHVCAISIRFLKKRKFLVIAILHPI